MAGAFYGPVNKCVHGRSQSLRVGLHDFLLAFGLCQLLYVCKHIILSIRKEVNDMSKQKKSGKVDRLATYINLTTALLILFEKLSG